MQSRIRSSCSMADDDETETDCDCDCGDALSAVTEASEMSATAQTKPVMDRPTCTQRPTSRRRSHRRRSSLISNHRRSSLMSIPDDIAVELSHLATNDTCNIDAQYAPAGGFLDRLHHSDSSCSIVHEGLSGSAHVTFALGESFKSDADVDSDGGEQDDTGQRSDYNPRTVLRQGHKFCICGEGDRISRDSGIDDDDDDDDECSVASSVSASTFGSTYGGGGAPPSPSIRRRRSSVTFNAATPTTSRRGSLASSSRRGSMASPASSGQRRLQQQQGSKKHRNSLLYSLLSRGDSGDLSAGSGSKSSHHTPPQPASQQLQQQVERRKKRSKQAIEAATTKNKVAKAASAASSFTPGGGTGQILIQEPTGVELWRIFYTTVERAADRGTVGTSEVLKRATYLTYLFLTIVVATVYAGMYYLVLDQTMAGHFAIFYVVLVLWSIEATVRYELYGYAHVLLKVLVVNPFNVQFALGGMINGGWVGMWGILSPVGAALILSPKSSRSYLAAFIFMVTVSCVFDAFSPTVPEADRLSYGEISLFWLHYVFFGTAVTASASIFAAQFQTEQSHSEGLLLNILPAHIARRLRRGESPIVDHYDDVTTLFADLVGFDSASETMSPDKLVGTILKDIFTAFDECVERRHMEKIKTIGSRYMAVSFLAEQTEDAESAAFEEDEKEIPTPASCAENAVLLGLDLQQALAEVNARHGTNLELRVGLHTGHVIAGVLGLNRFAFDVWGDAVNVASRMESYGCPKYVHITEDTYGLINQSEGKLFECKQSLHSIVKGKGLMKTFLLGRVGSAEPLQGQAANMPTESSPMGDEDRQVSADDLWIDRAKGNATEVSSNRPSPLSQFIRKYPKVKSTLWHKLTVKLSEPSCPQGTILKRQGLVFLWMFSIPISLILALFFLWRRNAPCVQLALAYLLCTSWSTYAAVQLRSFELFETCQMLGMLLSFLIAPSMLYGGIRRFGNGVIWMFIFPLISAIFHTPRKAQLWFLVYAVGTIVGHIFDSSYADGLLSKAQVVQFCMNNIGPLCVIFTAFHLYASEIKREHAHSESLLLNALPESVAKRLKQGEEVVDHYDNMTVLVADIAGFTKASGEYCPSFLIGVFLRDLFSELDILVVKRGLEKIKTVGDAFIVVGGMNKQKGSKHGAYQTLMLATEIHDAVRNVNERYGTSFQMRVGIHSGSGIAGVIGVKKFAYDIWGETVTTAHWMESHGNPGMTHISAPTYNLVNELGCFEYVMGIDIDVGSRGKTHFVTGRKGAPKAMAA